MKTLFDRVTLPTRIIVNSTALSANGLAGIVEKGEYSPSGGDTCDMEAGGQVLARGKIVRRRGRYFFKVVAVAEKGGKE